MDVKFRPLLIVVVLTAIATAVAQVLPPSRELRSVALLLDSVPLGGVVLATVIAALRLRRASLPLVRLLIAVYGYFAGALIGTLGVAHLVAIVVASLGRGRQQFVYSFRFYSLVLLGVLLIMTGLMAAMQAAHLARGHRGAWRASLSVWTAILAINLPLVPLQGFAIVFSVLAVLELLLLGGMRRHLGVQPTGRHVGTTISQAEVHSGGDTA
ncbi:MAG TPA: hypothetical protein VEK57_17885 [Thermoanaerobaculia bacterium]|nr:hypothetical protein [Thermoanaerobaculia bacterium]